MTPSQTVLERHVGQPDDEPQAPVRPERDAGRETEEVAAAGTLSRFFFLQTTFGILLALILTLGGVMTFGMLTKESLPDLDIPQATVTTTWPGADPQSVEEQVTQVIEDEFITLRGLKSLNSASYDSASIVSVEFAADADSQEAMTRLRAAISTAEGQLPREAEAPTITQVSVDQAPILTVVLYGDASAAALSDLAERLRDDIETVPGVNEANLGGARDEVVQVLLQPERLLSLGLSPTQVRQAITDANLEQLFGEIGSEEFGAVVRLVGRFRSVADLENLPIARIGQGSAARLVRLSELASVQRTLAREDTRAAYSEDGSAFRASVNLSVLKAPGADTIEVIGTVRALLDEAQGERDWPEDVSYAVTQDSAETITESLVSVFNNAWQAMLAVFVILFLVLTWREGLVAGLSIPVTFAGAMIVIWLLGYTLNELVIIGMVLALGLVVDVFILMMEGLHEEIYQNRKTFGQAALATIKRYGMPAFAGQLTTILALAPLMAIAGTQGKFIRVLPVTAIACLVIAFAVALLVAVPLSRWVLSPVARRGGGAKETAADRIMGRMSRGLRGFNERFVLTGKGRSGLVVGTAVGLFVLSIVAVTNVPLVLYPETDGETVGINVELPPAASLATSQEVADAVGAILLDKPYFESVTQLVGQKSPQAAGGIASSLLPSEAENFLGFTATFVDQSDRDAPSYELANGLREEVAAYLSANVPGADLLVVADTGSPTSGDPISITLTGDDLSTLQRLASGVKAALRAVPGTTEVRDNLGSTSSEVALRPRREALDFYGFSQQDLAGQIRIALSNDQIGTFVVPGPADDLDLLLGVQWSSNEGQGGGPGRMEELSLVRAFAPDGQTVPLLQLFEPVVSEAPVAIVHEGGEHALTVLAKTAGISPGEVMAQVTPELARLAEGWPSGYAYSAGGESAEAAETFGSAGLMLVVALIMVFGVLVIVFGSFPQAFIVLTAMPLALIGTFLGFWAFGLSFSFFAMIGVIALIGIVANNGIVMIDTMNAYVRDGVDVAEAAARGAADRLRPILTTSITTVVGLVPLAIGSPMYRPLCFAIIFGLIASTVLALVVVPALYLLLTGKSASTQRLLD